MNTQVVSQAAPAAQASIPPPVIAASGVFATADVDSAPATRATVSFTIARNDRQPLTKTFTAGPGGKPKASASAALAAGLARRKTLTGTAGEIVTGLATVLADLSQHEALILAPPPAGRDEWKVATKHDAAARADVIARTKEHFTHRPGAPAVVCLDIDAKDLPQAIRKRLDDQTITGALAAAFPATKHAARLLRASVSSGIRRKGDKTAIPPTGQHRYFVALDGADVSDFAARLSERLMLDGWIWGVVSSSGRILFRTLIDTAASADPARLFYEADAVLDPTLEYAKDARTPQPIGGGFLDTRQLLPLTDDERHALEQAKTAVRDSLKSEAQAAQARWAAEHGKKMTAAGVRPEVATKTVAAALEAGALAGDFPLQLDSGEVASVREILRSPKKYHGKTCCDPFEPEQGPNKAVIYTDGRQQLYTHLHGGGCYPLRQAAEDFFEAVAIDGDNDGWPEPVDLFGDGDPSALMDVPAGALPDVIDRYARDTAERMGAPVAFVAAGAVAVASAAIGGRLRIQPKAKDSGWTVPPFMWFALVEKPGGKKSPVISEVTKPLRNVDDRWSRTDVPKRQAWEIANRRRKKDETAIAPRPKLRRAMVNAFTVEGLRERLVENPRGVLVAVDEVTGLICGLDQYKSNGGSDRADLLELTDGHPRTIDRVAGSIRCDCWGASVLGGIQPQKIAEMAKGLAPDGLLQRFNPVVGDGVRRAGVDRAPDAAAMRDYTSVVEGLAEVVDYANLFDHPVVALSDEAQTARQLFEDRIDTLMDLPNVSDAWAGYLNKWSGNFARLLLVFHMLENWQQHGRDAAAMPVSGATAERAERFANFLLRHAIAFYETVVGRGPAGEAARIAAGIILVSGQSTITQRDIYQKHRAWRPNEAPHEMLDGMKILERLGWCTVADRVSNGAPGSWNINPAVFERFGDQAAAEKERRRCEYARVQAAVAERRAIKGAAP